MKYVNKIRLPFSETGVKGGLSVIGAAHIIEDNVCAFFAAFGRDSASIKAKYNAVWMLVKNKFRFGADLVFNEEITVESFFTRISAASVVIDTVIKNGKGEIALYARTETCAVDINTFKIRRVSSLELPETEIYAPRANFEFTRFPDPENSAEVYTFNVPSTAIDFCGHVNNVEYLRFVLNAVSVQEENKFPVNEVEIRYVNQSREGDELTLYRSFDDGGEVYDLKRDGLNVIKCRISRGKTL